MTLVKTKPKRPTTEHRKRVGHHHRHGHDYLKTYWPYLPVLAVLSLGVVANTWLAHLHRDVLGYATDMSAQRLLDDTNAERAANNESALKLNAALSQAAQAKAEDMAAHDYWSHDTPDGQTPWSFISAAGYSYQTAGENLAYGFATAGDTVQAWMNSPEHKANILDTNYHDVGFGIINTSNYQGNGPETLVVAMYGSASTASGAAPITTTIADTLEPAPARVTQLQLVSSNLPASTTAVAILGATAFAFVLIRHSFVWRRVLIRGERFVTKHPLLDITAISIASMTLILSHTAGLIH